MLEVRSMACDSRTYTPNKLFRRPRQTESKNSELSTHGRKTGKYHQTCTHRAVDSAHTQEEGAKNSSKSRPRAQLGEHQLVVLFQMQEEPESGLNTDSAHFMAPGRKQCIARGSSCWT